MPTWGEILDELNQSSVPNGGRPDWDGVRRNYLHQLHQLTGRNVIIYYTDWMSGNANGNAISITIEDMQAMMEVCNGLDGTIGLDLVLHSPGGSPEATDSIVRYLRQKFSDIRAFVPLAAMSAATMWALSANRIVMGKHSQLGPIDPQLVLPHGNVPARAILRQFDQARRECAADPSALSAWLPILQQYGPALLQQCEVAEALAKRLVGEWLAEYMLPGNPDVGPEVRTAKAEEIAAWFADYDEHQSHGLGIGRDAARNKGVIVDDLEAPDDDLQEAVLSVHHATMHTLDGPAVKVVENHLDRAFVKIGGQVQVPIAFGGIGGQSPLGRLTPGL